jgi:gamma-glutamylcyclotransferase (GGCT)/AIG2-like uncharacterized protein YtfP
MGDIQPPPGPPLPSPLPPKGEVKKASIPFKIRETTSGWTIASHATDSSHDCLSPLPGLYFFYGTLQHPELLQEVISLPSRPTLKPAYIIGYELKLWGQYPALIDKTGGDVEGSSYEVRTVADAERLQEYETKAYRAESCTIHFGAGEE